MTDSLDLALLLLRVMLAFVFAAHATQKLFGWFSGAGLAGSGVLLEKLGQRPGKPMAVIAATAESAAAVSVGIGLVTQLGAAIGAGTMLVAGGALSLRSKAFWNSAGGGEYPFVLAIVLIVVGFSGPGRFSLDATLGAPWHNSARWGAAIGGIVLAAAVVAALPPLLWSARGDNE
ncbi:DoxX family protein [Nocardia sp. BSTN01]|uniref:DoxX family protein n=1 Tax=Nocardia sp. BSTN01 TaxID=2783665 RepID=UPI0018901CB4|nr:DoxX family protein [Nocardia sp. BSTN01]MBF4996495.1 DoxX family protein [Nocardia sp. BSTN01]